MKGATHQGGEIVQVKGGHILRSTGRKDKHSKVFTSKGPRDRRVRLSAHTAIQFYDVQDRLGYDRPSKAVDWLIRKAKAAIDKLTELPPWQPPPPPPNPDSNLAPSPDSNPSSNDLASGFGLIQSNNNNPGSSNSSFMAPAGESIVNTMKSFFPTSSLSSLPGFTNEGVQPRGAGDLGLSLHSDNGNSGNLFPDCYQRINCGWSGAGRDSRVGFGMNSQAIDQHALFASQGLPFSNRELLQSNLGDPSWNQRSLPFTYQQSQSSDFGSPFEFGFGGTPGRIYGEEEPESHV